MQFLARTLTSMSKYSLNSMVVRSIPFFPMGSVETTPGLAQTVTIPSITRFLGLIRPEISLIKLTRLFRFVGRINMHGRLFEVTLFGTSFDLSNELCKHGYLTSRSAHDEFHDVQFVHALHFGIQQREEHFPFFTIALILKKLITLN